MDERDVDLLIERALWGLDPETERAVSSRVGGAAELESFDGVVGALAVSWYDGEEAPASVAASLRAAGMAWASSSSRAGSSPAEREDEAIPSAEGHGLRLAGGPPERGTPRLVGPVGWIGWIAAAACLVVAVIVSGPGTVRDAAGGVAERLAAVESRGDVIRAAWAGMSAIGASDHALDRGVSGEVVWSDEADDGVMRISGIEPNNPSEFQYQLWIFDAERPVGDLPRFAAEGLPEILTQRPVDGGVFDVSSSGEVLVPVDAKLPIGKGVLFAVTKERPGGVVVSDREIVFLALRG